MIIENHPTGGAAVLLYDMHGEYSGGLTALPYGTGVDFLRCEIVWDFSAIIDAASAVRASESWDSIDADVCDAFCKLFPGGLDEQLGVNVGSGMLWKIWGSKPESLERAFDHLLEVTNIQPSGDDDTFDYWPSAMRMLRVFAVDLDELVGGDHLSRYRTLIPNAGSWTEELLAEGKLEK